MAKQNNYRYIVFKGYIHKIPIIENDEETDNTYDKKGKIEKKEKEN